MQSAFGVYTPEQELPQQLKLDDFDILSEIGQGATGTVYKVSYIPY